MRKAMIMAGGAGTRLWPVSRAGRPKQLIEFIPDGDRQVSLLEIAARRLEGVVPEGERYICTGERFRDVILETLPSFTDERLLGEPEGRDTVNAVGFAAAVFAKQDPDAVFAVLTADHIISPQDRFQQSMDVGFSLVEEDPTRFVTFGITPTYPATGFGYIERDTPIEKTSDLGFEVARFVEKPNLQRATAYVESGDFLWNAGMFVFHARTFMDALARFKPESHAGLKEIAEAWGTDAQREVLDRVYPTLPKISVDYAVMEPASTSRDFTICGVSMDVDWLDVGSWPSFAEILEPDAHGNRTSGPVSLVTEDSKGNLVVGSGDDHTVALLGCEDLIVVRTNEATLVMPRDRAQDLKALHAHVRDDLK